MSPSCRGLRLFRRLILVGLVLLPLARPAPSRAEVKVGEITEYPYPFGAIADGIATGPDGNLWFTAQNGGGVNRVGRMATDGTVAMFDLPTQMSDPAGITAGPDGNLWFTEFFGDRIGRTTPMGTITEFKVTSSSWPEDITTGPDGALWFTEWNYGAIGRITTSGAVTEYQGIQGSAPFGIVTGTDGNLWFTMERTDKIGRITPSGTFLNPYGLPTGSKPHEITVGPDGNLWFIEYGRDRIGRMTPTGTLTEFPVARNCYLFGITAGPDGNLWFTELLANKVGVITTEGQITEYLIPTAHSQPRGITEGPDANLWFAESYGYQIGRITDAPIPAITLDPTSGGVGTPVRVTGSGFGSLERLKLLFVDSDGDRTTRGTAVAGKDGSFSTVIRVPTGAAVGKAHIGVRGVTSGLMAKAVFMVE